MLYFLIFCMVCVEKWGFQCVTRFGLQNVVFPYVLHGLRRNNSVQVWNTKYISSGFTRLGGSVSHHVKCPGSESSQRGWIGNLWVQVEAWRYMYS